MNFRNDLEEPGLLNRLSQQVLYDIDKAAVKLYHEEQPRKHLGASIIGNACSRQLWFEFRWVKHFARTGRQYRLFNRGHKEEARFIEWLKLANFEVEEVNPKTGKQWRINGIKGHFGGSLDGKIKLPESYQYNKTMLVEYKTNGTGAGFNKLFNEGVAIAKPIHFAQMSVYGYKEWLDYALYLNVCKNDDNIYTEIVKLDHSLGKEMERKAEVIITSQEAPPRISNLKTHIECKFCKFKEICFDGAPMDKNCRSCVNAEAHDDGKWFCHRWQAEIPEDVIPVGCDAWSKIYEA